MTVIVKFLEYILIGYLSGSVLYAYLLPRYLKHVDVTEKSGDGNPGAANAFLYAGIPVGVLVLVMELLKGFVPVHLAMGRLSAAEPLFGLVMAAPVLGHAFPLGNRRRGGKAIAVSFGVLLGIWPVMEPLFLLVALYLTFSLLVVVTPHFFRSVITFLLLFAGTAVLVELPGIVIGCGCVSGIVICKHLARYQGERMQVHLLQGSH